MFFNISSIYKIIHHFPNLTFRTILHNPSIHFRDCSERFIECEWVFRVLSCVSFISSVIYAAWNSGLGTEELGYFFFVIYLFWFCIFTLDLQYAASTSSNVKIKPNEMEFFSSCYKTWISFRSRTKTRSKPTLIFSWVFFWKATSSKQSLRFRQKKSCLIHWRNKNKYLDCGTQFSVTTIPSYTLLVRNVNYVSLPSLSRVRNTIIVFFFV